VEFYTLRPVCCGRTFGEKMLRSASFLTIFGNRARLKRRRTKTPCPPLLRQGGPKAQNHWKIRRCAVGVLPLAYIFTSICLVPCIGAARDALALKLGQELGHAARMTAGHQGELGAAGFDLASKQVGPDVPERASSPRRAAGGSRGRAPWGSTGWRAGWCASPAGSCPGRAGWSAARATLAVATAAGSAGACAAPHSPLFPQQFASATP
jgi:hypothetical protein